MRGRLQQVLQGVGDVISVDGDDIGVLLCREEECFLVGRFLPRLLSVLFPTHSPPH